ncbi:MAG: hypothetical protein ACSHX3_15960 [Litorimonas sp.]
MPGYAEERFTSKDFLEWKEEERSSYIQISLITANTIASRNDPTQSTCIGDWYDRNKDGANDYIYDVMKKNTDHHPVAIILAIAEKECGSFQYGQN